MGKSLRKYCLQIFKVYFGFFGDKKAAALHKEPPGNGQENGHHIRIPEGTEEDGFIRIDKEGGQHAYRQAEGVKTMSVENTHKRRGT